MKQKILIINREWPEELRPVQAATLVSYQIISEFSKRHNLDVGFLKISLSHETSEMDEILDKMKDSSIKSGIAINPDTPINKLEDYINKVDLVCLMGVHAGFGGQKFIEKTFDRLIELKSLIDSRDSSAIIEIDGGVDNTNSKKLKSLGADILVAGSYIFKSSDINNAIDSLK